MIQTKPQKKVEFQKKEMPTAIQLTRTSIAQTRRKMDKSRGKFQEGFVKPNPRNGSRDLSIEKRKK